jgi:hypothetical protein
MVVPVFDDDAGTVIFPFLPQIFIYTPFYLYLKQKQHNNPK